MVLTTFSLPWVRPADVCCTVEHGVDRAYFIYFCASALYEFEVTGGLLPP